MGNYSEWFEKLEGGEYDMRELSKKSSIIKEAIKLNSIRDGGKGNTYEKLFG